MITTVEYMDEDENLVQVNHDDKSPMWVNSEKVPGHAKEFKEWMKDNTIPTFVPE